MPLSDDEFEAWLKRGSDANRIILAEAKVYTGGSEVTRYLATKGFVSLPTDTPADQVYDEVIAEAPSFSDAIPEVFGGRSRVGWGSLVIDNANGERDDWLDEAWDGRDLTLLLGDASWPRDDFREILVGMTDDIVAINRTRLALLIRDKSAALTVPLQTTLIGGATANKDRLVPVAYGECFNVDLRLVTAASHEYQFNDQASEDVVDIRDNGVSLAAAYTENLGTSKPTLNAAPAGHITADVKGAKPGGSYLVTCADIIEDIVTTRTALTSGDLDATSFSDLNTDCPQTLGLFKDSYVTVGAVLDELVASVGAFWTFDLAGKLILGLFEEPSGTPDLEIDADDIERHGLAVRQRLKPIKTLRLGYKRNYTPQADGLAGAVTEANRALYAAEYQVVTATNSVAEHLLAEEPPLIPSLLVDPTEAQTEVDRRAALRDQIRFIYTARCFAAPYKLRLGQTVKVYNDRLGFSAGKLCTLVGYTWFPGKKRAVLELFA